MISGSSPARSRSATWNGDSSGFDGVTGGGGDEGTSGGPGGVGVGAPGLPDSVLFVLCDNRTGEIGRAVDASPVGRVSSSKFGCE